MLLPCALPSMIQNTLEIVTCSDAAGTCEPLSKLLVSPLITPIVVPYIIPYVSPLQGVFTIAHVFVCLRMYGLGVLLRLAHGPLKLYDIGPGGSRKHPKP